jgi:hypothetical protein
MEDNMPQRHHYLAYLSAGVLVVSIMVAILLVLSRATIGRAQTAPISPDVAVAHALAAAQDNGPSGGIVGKPTDIHGQVTTYGQAVQQVERTPMEPSQAIVKRDTKVWHVLLRGNFVAHIEGAPPDIPPKDEVFHQMSIILDGTTGEVMESTFLPANLELPINGMPVLSQPTPP